MENIINDENTIIIDDENTIIIDDENTMIIDDENTMIIDNQKFYYDCENNNLIHLESYDTTNFNKVLDKNTDCDDWYITNYDINFWEKILSRKLHKKEIKIFHDIWNENILNLDIKVLQKNIINNGCYIKSITNNIGNCLFESFAELGLGDNDLSILPCKMIRMNLASLLLAVKTQKGFFPIIPELTPEEIFANCNEIEFVKEKETNNVYVYNYDMMIIDLNSDFSWNKLPTEFLLMVISRIYQVEINIYHNNTNYINKINVWNNLNYNIEKILLGQINEEHYFPLLELPNNLKGDTDVIKEILNTDIKYDHGIKKFNKWSKSIINSYYSNIDNDIILENKSKEVSKLNDEQIYDYDQIDNLNDFYFL